MTTLILQLPPVTLKKDEGAWINDEIKFSVLVQGNPFTVPASEKFQVFRYENEGYEKFLFWKRSLFAFFDQANFTHQPAQKFKYVARTLMGEAREDWNTLVQSMTVNLNNQDDYVRVMCA